MCGHQAGDVFGLEGPADGDLLAPGPGSLGFVLGAPVDSQDQVVARIALELKDVDDHTEHGTGGMDQGDRGYPRVKPPFPAHFGLWGCPTTINNVETIANVPLIIKMGWEEYSKIGAPKHPGPILVGVSGHVNKPGVYEMPTGVQLTEIIYNYAGGVPGNKKIKAVIPGGSSTMILRGEDIEGVAMDAESLKNAGSAVGTAGLIVMDEDTDLIKVITRITKFYYHESCGQCTPCREGTGWMFKLLKRFENYEARLEDIDLLLDVANNIEGNTICALGDAAAWPVQSMIKRFRDEFEKRIMNRAEAMSPPIAAS